MQDEIEGLEYGYVNLVFTLKIANKAKVKVTQEGVLYINPNADFRYWVYFDCDNEVYFNLNNVVNIDLGTKTLTVNI